MPDYAERERHRRELDTIRGTGYTTSQRENLPPLGQGNLATLGLAIGLLLVVVQLWLLTIAFDAYLAGNRGQTLGVAICSGFVFLGGLLMLRFLNRRPARRH